ncbi:galactose oxidase-like [Coleophoma cylindrospora]|uniref:Galactose oxidase-like n=1 Tax=Coleophoma cylindrospora TaxID=1849047 RepID=A0A3D8S0W0_9HELO|nr:galactose oxidase-like [Coleophoma cylindrospora]
MKSTFSLMAIGSAIAPLVSATGFRTVGSSGSSAQMVFVPPYTDTVVFIDNYHANYGGPGYDISTGVHSDISYLYDGTDISVFGTEYNLTSNAIRPVKPLSNTFCSAGAFFPNGTLLNLAGAEAATGIAEGFDKLRTYDAGPCNGACDTDWVEQPTGLQVYRWYPSALTMVDGSVLIVGGSNVGGLVLNEASINVPTYEIVHANGQAPKAPVLLPILNFTEAENLVANKSYNLYPILHGLPNAAVQDQIFTVAGNQAVIWDYTNDVLVKTLPNTPLQPRTFPSSATSVLLPLEYPDYTPTVLMCGGASGDMPNPVTLDDCYRINPLDDAPAWVADDNLPNGPQVMTDGIQLPNGKILFINGARKGCAGGYQADDPVLIPLLYDPSAAPGARFTSMPPTTIPRLYHSAATILPSGEVLVAGSNPAVGYSRTGAVTRTWPYFNNNGHRAALHQQQNNTSYYPTEYRVDIFSPPYLSSISVHGRPVITTFPANITYGTTFNIEARLELGARIRGNVQINLLAHGFHTHGVGMGQRMVKMGFKMVANSYEITVHAPRDASIISPGIYMLFVVEDDIPSVGQWISIA